MSALGNDVHPVTTKDFDIADFQAVDAGVQAYAPDLVIHTAAYTDVDACERNPDQAFRVNALGSWCVATAAQRVGARLVVISTDFVFNGEKETAYNEFDQPCPINQYGASKLEGERLATRACSRTTVVRAPWLFGVHGKCFPRTILNLARTRSELTVVADQVGTPTGTRDLANAISEIVESPLDGIYHVSNSGECSWHEFAETVLAVAGLSRVRVKPIRSEEWPSPTRRPHRSVLRNYVRELFGVAPLRPWQDAVSEFVTEINAADASEA
jgi:dTDP-4-dehydrorhamnose reductase